jgi:hypothetical protein
MNRIKDENVVDTAVVKREILGGRLNRLEIGNTGLGQAAAGLFQHSGVNVEASQVEVTEIPKKLPAVSSRTGPDIGGLDSAATGTPLPDKGNRLEVGVPELIVAGRHLGEVPIHISFAVG